MILLVCGSRTWDDYDAIWAGLEEYGISPENLTVMHGNAYGADRIAGQQARDFGVPPDRILSRPANWNKYGKAAGRIRNLEMLTEAAVYAAKEVAQGNSVAWTDGIQVLAFYRGKFSAGTQMMIDYCERFGIPVEVIREE